MIKAAHSPKVNHATFGIDLCAFGSRGGEGNESLKDELNVL